MSEPNEVKKPLTFNRIVGNLASPKIFYYACLWLCVLVFVGTIRQGDLPIYGDKVIPALGLKRAQDMFFSSWFYYLGSVPILPSGRLTLAVVFVNLLAKFMFKSTWSKKRVGINITHFGALLLLAGGFITGKASYEGHMRIAEGETVNYFSDFHEAEFVWTKLSDTTNKVVAIAEELWEPESELAVEGFPGKITFLKKYHNASWSRRMMQGDVTYKGKAQTSAVTPQEIDPRSEANVRGVVFEISGAGDADGQYEVLEEPEMSLYDSDEKQFIEVNGETWRVELRRRRYYVPFTVQLKDVRTEYYEGSDRQKAYEAEIMINGKDYAFIEMNQPYRGGGYTLFQSNVYNEPILSTEAQQHYASVAKTDAKSGGQYVEVTGFSVVKNVAWQVPYWSSVIMSIGLLLHAGMLFVQFVKAVGKDSLKEEVQS